MKVQAILVGLATLPVALGHGVVTTPPPRVVSAGFLDDFLNLR